MPVISGQLPPVLLVANVTVHHCGDWKRRDVVVFDQHTVEIVPLALSDRVSYLPYLFLSGQLHVAYCIHNELYCLQDWASVEAGGNCDASLC